MAITSGFFDGEGPYGQEDLLRYYDNIFESGVSIDDTGEMTLKVTNTTEGINIAPGFVIIKGAWLYSDTTKVISIIADSNYTRIDRMILRRDYSGKNCNIVLKPGTPTSVPIPPGLTRNTTYWELSLAQVKITKTGVITVKDERASIILCGAIRPKNLTEYKTMIKTFQNQWEAWFDQQQSQGWRKIYIQDETPSNPTVGSIWIG